MASVRVGTSDWRYAPWRGNFYPKGLPHRRELEGKRIAILVAPEGAEQVELTVSCVTPLLRRKSMPQRGPESVNCGSLVRR